MDVGVEYGGGGQSSIKVLCSPHISQIEHGSSMILAQKIDELVT